jgi:succinate dehydrogenase / fumarate reductase, iron-sulfur subunit
MENRQPQSINVKILRQDGPGQPSYWERHQVPYEENMNIISVLQKIAAQATTVEGKKVSPVAWDCGCLEEVCGSCTMLVNGRVRQSCSALVDRLLEDNPEEIELQPMSKFPVIRDLLVDRSRLFRGLQRVKAWVPRGWLRRHGARSTTKPPAARAGVPLESVHELRMLP